MGVADDHSRSEILHVPSSGWLPARTIPIWRQRHTSDATSCKQRPRSREVIKSCLDPRSSLHDTGIETRPNNQPVKATSAWDIPRGKFANNDNCETDLGDCLFVCASAQRTHCREHTGDMKRGDCAHTQRMHTRHTRLPSAIAGAILPPDVMFHFAHSCSCAKGTQFYDAQSGMQDDMTAAAYPPRAGMRLLWSKVGTRADTDRMHSSVVGQDPEGCGRLVTASALPAVPQSPSTKAAAVQPSRRPRVFALCLHRDD